MWARHLDDGTLDSESHPKPLCSQVFELDGHEALRLQKESEARKARVEEEEHQRLKEQRECLGPLLTAYPYWISEELGGVSVLQVRRGLTSFIDVIEKLKDKLSEHVYEACKVTD